MGKRVAGATIIVTGSLLVVAGIAGMALNGGDETSAATPTGSEQASGTAEPSVTQTPTPTPPVETPEEFLERFVAAIRGGDADFLLERLHPIVVEFYGERTCRHAAEDFRDKTIAITFVSARGPGIYRWVVDGHEEDVADVLTVGVVFDRQGETSRQRIHLGIVGSELRWFTDCGNPRP